MARFLEIPTISCTAIGVKLTFPNSDSLTLELLPSAPIKMSPYSISPFSKTAAIATLFSYKK